MELADDQERERRLRYQEPAGRNRRDSQNTTIYGWIKPGTEFTFTCQFDNLHPLELGALLWILDPTRLGRPDQPGRLRLGWGKPLGFGSVELTATATTVRTGTQIADRISSLGANTDTIDVTDLPDQFQQAMCATPRLRHLLDEVRLAAIGYRDNTPVDYPRDPETRHAYTWFVENEKAATTNQAQSLPPLGGPPLYTW